MSYPATTRMTPVLSWAALSVSHFDVSFIVEKQKWDRQTPK